MTKPYLNHSENAYGILEIFIQPNKINAYQTNSKINIELGISATLDSRLLGAFPMKVLGSFFLSHFMVMKLAWRQQVG